MGTTAPTSSSSASRVAPRANDGQDAKTKVGKNSAQAINMAGVKAAKSGPLGGFAPSNVTMLLGEMNAHAPNRSSQQIAAENSTPGSYTAMLNDYLGAEGGGVQLQSYIQFRGAMNAQTVEEMNVERGGTMTEAQKKEELARLNDGVALDVMGAMLAFEQGGGTLGSDPTGEVKLTYEGLDLIRDLDVRTEGTAADFVNLLNPAKLADMTDTEITAELDKMLGANGGGDKLKAARDGLRDANNPAALATFDRGLLTNLGSIAVATSVPNVGKEWATRAGGADVAKASTASAKGNIFDSVPKEFRGNIMSVIAYVFGVKVKEVEKQMATELQDFLDNNKNAGEEQSDEDKNTLATQQLKIKELSELKSNLESMASSLISTISDTIKSIWR